MQISVYDTYLTRNKCNFDLRITLGFNDTLIWLDDVVPWGRGLDFVHDVSLWRGVVNLKTGNELLRHIGLSFVNRKLDLHGGIECHKL